MLHIDKKNFKAEIMERKEPVILDCWAAWCGPCRMAAPIFEKLEGEYKGKLKFSKMDVDANTDLAAMLNVMSIPTFIIFNKGEEVDRFMGFGGEADMKHKIDKVLKL